MLKKYSHLSRFAYLSFVALLMGCATESHNALVPQQVASANTHYSGEKTTLAVGNFQNQSNYMQGLFSAGTNALGSQAKTILKTHLQQTNRFNIVDRSNLEQMKKEAQLRGLKQNLQGARYLVAGDVTEFGRKVTGDHQLFGILGASKKQTAYAKVALNIIDVQTSSVVYSTQGAGEYNMSNREIIGFGGTASYDATLNGKVLNFAITEAVNNLVNDLQSNVWSTQK